jgi:hypothetical protein
VAGDRDAQATVALRLERRGHSTSQISAKAYARDLKRLQEVERLMAGTRKQRDRLLREVERRRKAFAARLQGVAYVQTDDDGKPRSSHRADDQPVLAHPSNAASSEVEPMRSGAAPEQDERLRWVHEPAQEGGRGRAEYAALVHEDARLRHEPPPEHKDKRLQRDATLPEDETLRRDSPPLHEVERPPAELERAQLDAHTQRELALLQEEVGRHRLQARDAKRLLNWYSPRPALAGEAPDGH